VFGHPPQNGRSLALEQVEDFSQRETQGFVVRRDGRGVTRWRD
jgi:hypothetical protein